MKINDKTINDLIKPFLKHLVGFFAVTAAHLWFFMIFVFAFASEATKNSPWMAAAVIIWAIGDIFIVAGIRTFMEYEEKKKEEILHGTNN